MRGPRLPHLPPGRRGPGAPPPERVAGPPTCSSKSAQAERRTWEGRAAQPRASAQGARGVLRGPRPRTPSGGRTGGSDPRPWVSEEDDPDARRAWGRRGCRARQGRLRRSRTSAGVPLVAKRLPARRRPSSGAFLSGRFSRIPDPLPGSAREAASAGGSQSPDTLDAARRRLGVSGSQTAGPGATAGLRVSSTAPPPPPAGA